MNGNDFPLSPFLAALAADGISLTLRDYARIHLALQTDGAWTITRLRDTLLGLLARDVDQQELFLRRFHDFFALELAVADTVAEIDVRQVLADLQQLAADQPAADPPKARPLQRSSLIPPLLRKPPRLNFGFWTVWASLLVIGLITIGYFLSPFLLKPPPPETLPVPTVPSETPATPTVPPVSPSTVQSETPAVPPVSPPRTRLYTDVPFAKIHYESLPTIEVWQRNATIATFFLFATLLYGLYLWRSRKIPEDKAPAYNPAGPRHFALGSIGGPPAPRLDDVTLNELADSMGYFQSGERGRRLDVAASIQLTMHRGGVPALEFHKRQQLRSLLILEDAFAEPLAWNPLAGELAAGMARLGVPVLYGRFHGSPAQFKTQDNAVHRLEDLEDQRNGFLLLVFTDGKSLQRQASVFALEELARWPMVAWMELREPRLWDENTALPRDYAIPLYPATPAGALNAVRRFLTEQGAITDNAVNERSWRAIPNQIDVRLDAHVEQLLGDALLWAQACAMLQPVNPGLADALRRAFYPALPAERIERLYALPGTLHNVSGLRFAADVLRVLRTGFLVRRTEAEQEQVLRFLVDQIEKAEPAEGDSPAHLAWEAVKERVHLELDQDAALVRLAQLAKTPVGAAISASLDNFGFREDTDKIPLRLKPKNRHAWQRLARIAEGFNIPKLEAYPVGWEHLLAVGLLALAVVGFTGLSIASYLRPPLPAQNWKVVGVGETYARLAFKAETAEGWSTEHSGELHTMTGLPLHPEREYQLVLFGGGAKTVNLMPVKNHQMTVIALATKTQEVDCRTEFVDIGLTVERCADVGNVAGRPVQQPTWRGKLGDAAPGSRLMSIGLEIAGQADNDAVQRVRNLLLATSSVDLIYRIQPDASGYWQIGPIVEQIQADLGPLRGQSQLIWWVVGPMPATIELKQLLLPFDRPYQLGEGEEPAWAARLTELLSVGPDLVVTQDEIRQALGEAAPIEAASPLVLLRSITSVESITAVTPTAIVAASGDSVPVSSTMPITGDLWTEPTYAITFVYVPAGKFLMGSSDADEDEKPQQTIHVDAFWIMRTEVTNAHYRAFVETKGYEQEEFWTAAGWQWRQQNNITAPACWDDKQLGQDDYPVVCVSWYEAVAYARWLSNATGQTMRLPTEAEWEKAARGTAGHIYPWGSGEPNDQLLNYNSNVGTTAPAGNYSKGANSYGALDMAGNAWEWTSSLYMSYPYQATDGREELESGACCRVLRGGSWYDVGDDVRAASRYGGIPVSRYDYVGMRLVVGIPNRLVVAGF